jgi:hypothetical protein
LPIPELQAFGPLWCVNSSFWPIVHQLGWLHGSGFSGVRLQLGLSLNLLAADGFCLELRQIADQFRTLKLVGAGGRWGDLHHLPKATSACRSTAS